MSKLASKQYVLDRLGEYLEWGIAYMRASRAGETNEMTRLEADYQALLEAHAQDDGSEEQKQGEH